MSLELKLLDFVVKAISASYSQDVDSKIIQFQKTKKEFVGDITLVTFPLLRISKQSPEQTGEVIGRYLVDSIDEITGYNTVKGFLNLEVSNSHWVSRLSDVSELNSFGFQPKNNKLVMVEYSSPNTNKPLHLGHLRNNFLGYSVAEILKANGYEVVKTQIVNDRGVHICKSMLAWERFGNGETPATSGLKGDKLVGKYYVAFDKALKVETEVVMNAWEKGVFAGVKETVIEEITKLFKVAGEKDEKGREIIINKIKEIAKNHTPIMADTKEMLLKWESKDPEVYQLWEKMNGWVYKGFESTYEQMGVDFQKIYYESDTYITGKKLVEAGLEKGIFFKKEDGSIWIDLTDDGLDEKLVLRGDGTAVYMTQDMGTASQRFLDYPNLDGITYTVGNEQDYHFKVLFLILKKLGYAWADNCAHLSYGMVELRNSLGEVGKMKSREGTVVDADDLMAEIVAKAKESTQERGHLEGFSDAQKEELYDTIGMGGLKYYLLKVDPKKSMAFNPEESVDLNGNTGPFIQYAHARISSLLAKDFTFEKLNIKTEIHSSEKELIKWLLDYPELIKEAGLNQSPALIANYTYELVKLFNSFYQSVSIFKEENKEKINLRLQLSKMIGETIASSMGLLGIKVPAKM